MNKSNQSNACAKQELAQAGLDALKESGVRLGQPPKLTLEDVARVEYYRENGVSYKSIAKMIKKPRKSSDTLVPVSPQTIKQAMTGNYQTLEDWEQGNEAARNKLKKGNRKATK
jgi:hypothetical protein